MRRVERLDDPAEIKKIDRSDMLGVVGRWPEMLAQAEGLARSIALPKFGSLKQIMILGMGGSAIAGDIAADFCSKKAKLPIFTNRNYNLPEFVGSETLVFALSYSGGTEETLAGLGEAEKRGAKIICVASGGKLKEIAQAKKYPLFLIPGDLQPRAALAYMLIPLLVSLERLGVITPLAEEIKEAITAIFKLKGELVSAESRLNPAKQLAKKLAGKIPVIFASSGTTAAAGLRLKCQLNENGKTTALLSIFPELDHNEIVNLAALKRESHNFSLIVLRDEDDGDRVKKRIEITKSLLVRQLGGANEIVSRGKSSLARQLSLIFFGDLVSVYLAIENGIDPTPVDIITRLKKELAR